MTPERARELLDAGGGSDRRRAAPRPSSSHVPAGRSGRPRRGSRKTRSAAPSSPSSPRSTGRPTASKSIAWVDNLDARPGRAAPDASWARATRTCQSLVPVYRGANWMERECFDMFGRALRRPSRSAPHPARRRLGGASAAEVLRGRYAASAVPVDARPCMPDVRALDYTGSERLTMNMGPQHPSAHGVFRAILTLEGETVVGVDAVIGYLHRCHEKLAETLAYVQYPTIASKTDYVAAMSSELAYVMAAERIGQVRRPEARAVPARASSASCSGSRRTACGSARGAWTWAARSAAARRSFSTASASASWCSICSNRWSARGCSTASTRSAASATTFPRAGRRSAAARSMLIEQRLDEYEAMLEDNPFFTMRTQGVGVISTALAQDVGVSGPLLRGSGVDVRSPARASRTRRTRTSTSRVPVETARRLPRAVPRPHGRVPRVDPHRPADPRRPARGADLVASRREVAGAGEGARRAKPTRASKGRAGKSAATWSPTAPTSRTA